MILSSRNSSFAASSPSPFFATHFPQVVQTVQAVFSRPARRSMHRRKRVFSPRSTSRAGLRFGSWARSPGDREVQRKQARGSNAHPTGVVSLAASGIPVKGPPRPPWRLPRPEDANGLPAACDRQTLAARSQSPPRGPTGRAPPLCGHVGPESRAAGYTPNRSSKKPPAPGGSPGGEMSRTRQIFLRSACDPSPAGSLARMHRAWRRGLSA